MAGSMERSYVFYTESRCATHACHVDIHSMVHSAVQKQVPRGRKWSVLEINDVGEHAM